MMPHFSRPNMPRARREIDDRLDVVDAEFMLRQAHAVHDHGGARLAV